uniref:Sulfotransfer_1 domain-containing protein n=1 Tax=Angiostrongylus cantonensis TaxID=6313 RepID=A0A0K0CTR5_ANGCA
MKCWSHECLVTLCLVLVILAVMSISRRLPTALIIGVRKGGTRALLDALALHPKIKAARKEAHYFNLNYSKGVEWYRSLMPPSTSDEVIIEKTPGYFTSPIAPRRIYEFNPSMKIILIVRDPTQRTISDFTQVYYNKLEQNKTLPVFEKEAFLAKTDVINTNYKPIRNSLYDLHMVNWLRYFSMEQILLVNGEVFRGNPISELRRVETFLGLTHEISDDQLIFNEQKGFFCFRRSPGSRVKCLGDSKGRPHREIVDNVIEKLRNNLRPHNRRFFALVNRFFNW